MDDTTLDLGGLFVGSLWVLAFGIIALAAVLAFVAWALYRAGNRHPYAALVTSLAIIAVSGLLIYAVGGAEREEVIALSSIAIGALAATLGALASRNTPGVDHAPPTPPEWAPDTPESGDTP